jgi:hypothetical protein
MDFIEELGPDLGDLPDAAEESQAEEDEDMENEDADDSYNALHRGHSSAGSSDTTEELDSLTYMSEDDASSPRSDGSGFVDSLFTLDELLIAYFGDIIAGSATAVPPRLTADIPDHGNDAVVPFRANPRHVPGHGPLASFQIYTAHKFEHYIANVRGQSHEFHVSDRHYGRLGAGELLHNPQRPSDVCHLQDGYQVVILTYTRDTLKGAFERQERDMPPWGF